VTIADNFQAVGGGDMVEAQTVGNNHSPVDWMNKPKECIVIATLAADVMPALLTATYVNMTGANTALSALVVTEKNTAGLTRTVTYTAANSKIKTTARKNILLGEQTIEVKIGTYGTVTYSSWA